MTSPQAKLREARFFLTLMKELERSGQPLVERDQVRDEMAFLLSALLNSLYAVTEHLKAVVDLEAVKNFKTQHPLIFGSKLGLRNLTVHERHVAPSSRTYIPTNGGANLVFSQPRAESADLVFRAEYYFEPEGESAHIVSLSSSVLASLESFAGVHGIHAET